MENYKLTIEVPGDVLRDILTTAVEQGCAYWANDFNGGEGNGIVRDTEGYVTSLTIGQPLDGSDAEGVEVAQRTVQAVSLGRALSTHGGKFPHLIAAAVSGDFDAPTADAILQLAVFGDVVFG